MRDRLPEQEANIALLIDADNASPDHLDEVLLVLGELGTINIRRAYGNWAKASLKGWGELPAPIRSSRCSSLTSSRERARPICA